MAVAVASSATTTYASVSSITISKPSSLAEGDLMVAFIHKIDGTNTTCSLTGWTTIHTIDDTARTGDYGYVLYKIASSADAAASNFTFTLGETKITGGSIMRITDFNAVAPINTSNTGYDNINNTAQQTSGSVTPTENGLLLLCFLEDGVVTNSGYFITNNNPSWTEIVDQNDGSNGSMAIAWAYRPQLTDTGTWGCTSSGSSQSAMAIISIANSTVQVSDTATLSDSQNYELALVQTDSISTTEDINIDNKLYRNVVKNSSSWVNQDKTNG